MPGVTPPAYFTGKIAYTFMINGPLSGSDVTNLFLYLKYRYGITSY